MRIGILGNEGSWYVAQICRAAQARGHDTYELAFPKLKSGILNEVVQLTIGDIRLDSLDAVIVRTMPPGSLEQVVARMDLLAGLAEQGVRVINSPKAIECAVDKYLTTQRLAQAGIPVPDTVVCENSETALEAFEELGRDVVVKPLFGAEGRGLMRVDHPELALRTFRTLERQNAVIYLQRFLADPGRDVRILLLDDEVVASIARQPSEGDFRANLAQQGRAAAYQPTDREIELSRKSADVTGCVFAGVDLMQTATGETVVIEVNAVPGWRSLQRYCRVNVPDRLIRWLEGEAADVF